MATVEMVQVYKHKWKIVSTKHGNVLQHDIYIGNPYDAELYVRAYCSSFSGWSYEMKPLPKETK